MNQGKKEDARPLVSVAMATYNGAQYLEAQLQSIYRQSYQPLEVVVSDDASSDRTCEILNAFAKSDRLRYETSGVRRGVVQNFARALEMASARYVALADQDDVWSLSKVRTMMDEMTVLEGLHGTDVPILLFSDLRVVDSALEVIHPSYFRYTGKRPGLVGINRLIVENVVVGCSALVNRALVNVALPFPPETTMHDLWLALVASAFGIIRCMPQALTLYRQHPNNVLGARAPALRPKLLRKLHSLRFDNASYRKQFDPHRAQAATFLRTYEGRLTFGQKRTLEQFVGLPAQGFLGRRLGLIKNRFLRHRISDAVEMLIRI